MPLLSRQHRVMFSHGPAFLAERRRILCGDSCTSLRDWRSMARPAGAASAASVPQEGGCPPSLSVGCARSFGGTPAFAHEARWTRPAEAASEASVPRRLVEAAGVEPASERPVAAGIYMRIRSFVFAAGIKERRNRRPLAPVVSPSRSRRAAGPAC